MANNVDPKGATYFASGNLRAFSKKRKLPPKNILLRLIHRETFFVNSNVLPQVAIHRLHQNLVPNFSVENIEKPNCFLRKFTYDGRYLMAFSADQNSVEIYEYQGPAAAAHLMRDISSTRHDFLPHSGPQAAYIRKHVFDCFFALKHVVNVTSNGEQLNRECSLFTENHRFAIVVSAAFASEDAIFYNLYQNNESLSVGTRALLEDYTVHIIDIAAGRVIDRRQFKTDKIHLSYNHGIYLYKNTLAILSIQHQTIHIFHITDDGKLIDVRKIGRFCFEDDEYLLEKARAQPLRRSNVVPAFRETPFNALKHRLLAFLFKKARHQSMQSGDHNLAIKNFFASFDLFANLRIWKMQLLDDEHLLIKYEQEETLLNRETFFRSQNLFVVYNLRTSNIVNVYMQFSDEFLFIYENFLDYFRHPSYYICSLSNNIYARQIHDQLMKACTEAKNGSHIDAVKMILAMLPLNAQSYSPSPYLDLSLFSYDERSICVYEKPRQCTDLPVRFYDRQSNRLLYKITMSPDTVRGQNSRRLVAYILHPTDPLVISVIRSNSNYTVNLHFRHNNPTTDEPATLSWKYFQSKSQIAS